MAAVDNCPRNDNEKNEYTKAITAPVVADFTLFFLLTVDHCSFSPDRS